jgi:hypothetical protein
VISLNKLLLSQVMSVQFFSFFFALPTVIFFFDVSFLACHPSFLEHHTPVGFLSHIRAPHSPLPHGTPTACTGSLGEQCGLEVSELLRETEL